jgi:hypothetical protein
VTGARRNLRAEQIGSDNVGAIKEGIDVMTAALGTLVFLTTVWFLVVVGAAILEESGAKIAAALKGRSAPVRSFHTLSVRMRARPRLQQPTRATAQWRAAA